MEEIFIEREIIKKGFQRIKLTDKEIESIGTIFNSRQRIIDEEYYRKKIMELLAESYSKKFANYIKNEQNNFFENIVELCYENQEAIDNIGIYFIYDLDTNLKENIKYHYQQMSEYLDKEEFINDIVENYENFTTSDLQGVVQARCMRTKEDENAILNEIYNKVDNKI